MLETIQSATEYKCPLTIDPLFEGFVISDGIGAVQFAKNSNIKTTSKFNV